MYSKYLQHRRRLLWFRSMSNQQLQQQPQQMLNELSVDRHGNRPKSRHCAGTRKQTLDWYSVWQTIGSDRCKDNCGVRDLLYTLQTFEQLTTHISLASDAAQTFDKCPNRPPLKPATCIRAVSPSDCAPLCKPQPNATKCADYCDNNLAAPADIRRLRVAAADATLPHPDCRESPAVLWHPNIVPACRR